MVIRGIDKEFIRLGDSSARRAERDLLARGVRARADVPIKDLEDGALLIMDVSFGYDEGWATTEANADRIKLEGYSVLRNASVRSPQDHPEACKIYLMREDGTQASILAMGESSIYDYLTWCGELWLQGTWYVDAGQLVAVDRANGSKLNVVYQRMMRGMTPGG